MRIKRIKQLVATVMAGFFLATIGANTLVEVAYAKDTGGDYTTEEINRMYVISSEGVFAPYERATTTCDDEAFQPTESDEFKKLANIKEGKKSGGGGDEGITEMIKNMSVNMIETISAFFIKIMKGFFNLGCSEDGGLGVTAQLFVVTKPVNVTLMQGVMGVTAAIQWISLGLGMLMIAYYGVTLSTGIQQTSPMVFAIRMFLAFIGVWLAPYLVQDILSINNFIVHTLMTMSTGVEGTGASTYEAAFISTIQRMFLSFLDLGLYGVAVILFALIAVIFGMFPLFKLVLWWYTRWFRLMLYTVISPLMFLSVGLRETSRTASGFIHSLVSDVFSQTIVVIGVMLVTNMMPSMVSVLKTYNLGVIGVAIALYAMLTFLATVPEMASSLIKGDASGFGLKSLESFIKRSPKNSVKGYKTYKKWKNGKNEGGNSGGSSKSGSSSKSGARRTFVKTVPKGSIKGRRK